MGGTDTTTAKAADLATLTGKTADAEAAVQAQLARVEELVLAQRTQDNEVTLWAERVATANTAYLAAGVAKGVAQAAQTEVEE